MRVYLDNCCYNRPFDDQGQTRVKLEVLAKLTVQMMMALRKIEYVWSKILDYEIKDNPFPRRKAAILRWRCGAAEYIETDIGLIDRARELMNFGLRHKDALHVASAERAECDWFLTTDRGILKKLSICGKTKIANPIDFIMEVYHGDNR